jgi:nitroimidazol reductase NimA-like FMN-containing flavoprotein (pyridoxamine 5'-phosphate oxidase superfamily)
VTAPTGAEIVELPRAECLQHLAASRFGRLAVVSAHGTPVIRPVNYVFDDASQSVVFRTGLGTKFHALLSAEKATFEIDGIDNETQTGWSVIISGVTEEITSRQEIDRLTAAGIDTWVPDQTLLWIRIRAYTVTGRRIVLR